MVKELDPEKREISIPVSFPQAGISMAGPTDMMHPVKMEMRPVPRIPSLPIINPEMMTMTTEDVLRGERQESHPWESYPTEWSDGQNVWNFSVNDIPGSK